MKNLNFSFLGVKNLLFVIAIAALTFVFSSCGKGSDTGSGSTGPILPPTPITPVITPPTAPTTPLWNGDSFSGTISISNAPTGAILYQDGVVNTSGTLSLTNLTASKTVGFELRKADGITSLATASIRIDVLGPVRTNLAKANEWRNFYCSVLGSDNVWRDFAPGCASSNPDRKFFATGNTCIAYTTRCNFPINASPAFSMDATESQYSVANETMRILRSTSDSLFTESVDGKLRLSWVKQ